MFSINDDGRSKDRYSKMWSVSRDAALLVELILKEVPLVRALINSLVDRICSTRCTIQVKEALGSTSDGNWSNEGANSLFDSQLQSFERKVVASWAAHGYAVGYFTYEDGSLAATRTPKNIKLNFMRAVDCDVKWYYSKQGNIKYAVFPALVRNLHGQENAHEDVRKEIPNSFVLPFGELNRTTCVFDSHLLSAKVYCGDLRMYNILAKIGIVRQVFPLVVKSVTDGSFQLPLDSITPDILNTVNAGVHKPGHVPVSAVEVHQAVETATRNVMTDIVTDMDSDPRRVSAEVHDFFSALNPFSATLESDLMTLIGKDPLKPSYTLVPGMTINKDTPQSKLPGELVGLITKRENDLREIFGLPKDDTEGKFTAGVVKHETQYLYTTQNYRLELETVIRNLYMDIYGVCFTSKRNEIPALKEDKLFSKFPTYVTYEKEKRKQPKLEQKAFYRIEHARKYHKALNGKIIIDVTYTPTTTGELQDIIQLYDRGVIGFEAFQSLALSTAKIPNSTHLKMTSTEYKELDKRKIQSLLTGPEEETAQQGQQAQSAKRQRLPKTSEMEKKLKKKEKVETV